MADFASMEEDTDRPMIYEGGSKKRTDVMSDTGKSARSHKSAKPLSQAGSAKGSVKSKAPS
jgi:hypothetical protein